MPELTRPDRLQIMLSAAELKVPLCVLCGTGRLPDVARVLDRHRDALDVCIDHMADCPLDRPAELAECFAMLTARSARLMRRENYGIAVGNSADLVVFDCPNAQTAVVELVSPLFGLKAGRLTFTRPPAKLSRSGVSDQWPLIDNLLT